MREQELIEFVIRPYRDEDFEDVIENITQGGILDPALDDREHFRRKSEADPESILVASTENHGAVGNVFIVHDGWVAMVFRLAVRERFRDRTSEFGGKGVGLHLMEAAEAALAKRGASSVSLLVHEELSSLESWYHNQGYRFAATFHVLEKRL